MSVQLGRIPGGVWGAAQSMRIGPMARLPFTLGWMAKRPEHASRLAALASDEPVQWIADSYTLIPLDQPEELAHSISQFVRRPS